MSYTRAFSAGWESRRAGAPRTACPFAWKDDVDDWLSGWDMANSLELWKAAEGIETIALRVERVGRDARRRAV